MNSDQILSLIDELEDNIGDVEANIGPLLNDTFSITTKKLPLLDKAKVHVLIVYAIESLLFSRCLTLQPVPV
jgi:exosome complex protein LRP1